MLLLLFFFVRRVWAAAPPPRGGSGCCLLRGVFTEGAAENSNTITVKTCLSTATHQETIFFEAFSGRYPPGGGPGVLGKTRQGTSGKTGFPSDRRLPRLNSSAGRGTRQANNKEQFLFIDTVHLAFDNLLCNVCQTHAFAKQVRFVSCYLVLSWS